MPYLRRPINFQLIALFIFHTHMFNFIATGLANTFLEHGNVRPIEKKKKKQNNRIWELRGELYEFTTSCTSAS